MLRKVDPAGHGKKGRSQGRQRIKVEVPREEAGLLPLGGRSREHGLRNRVADLSGGSSAAWRDISGKQVERHVCPKDNNMDCMRGHRLRKREGNELGRSRTNESTNQ